jgi:hypothetical protein
MTTTTTTLTWGPMDQCAALRGWAAGAKLAGAFWAQEMYHLAGTSGAPLDELVAECNRRVDWRDAADRRGGWRGPGVRGPDLAESSKLVWETSVKLTVERRDGGPDRPYGDWYIVLEGEHTERQRLVEEALRAIHAPFAVGAVVLGCTEPECGGVRPRPEQVFAPSDSPVL